ncbi:MAG TPA: diacylglycerol kinase family protein [Candidatus Competibacteraceae bacterium]|nr:diacylglycerol kinase family protein [Candidatus Competibacteraceae bacterium]
MPLPTELNQTIAPWLDGRKLRVGLLTNPDSGRNRRWGLRAINRVLADYPDVYQQEVRTPAEVATGLAELARREVAIVAINAGDGTVQAVLTTLLQAPAAWRPLLALLRGGTANMTAGDVGLPGSSARALRRLLHWATTFEGQAWIVRRPILRIQTAPDQSPLFGMFFGAGAIIQGIEICHQRFYSRGLNDKLATAFATVWLLLAVARRSLRPVSFRIGLDGSPLAPPEDYLVILASTLERLFHGLHPYWGPESGPLHYTAVRASPAHVLRAVPPMLWGRPCRFGTVENGYISHNVGEIRLSMDGLFTLDGELHQADSRIGPVVIGQGGPVSFLRL